MRLMFSARHTGCHSPRTFSTPRRLNRLKGQVKQSDDMVCRGRIGVVVVEIVAGASGGHFADVAIGEAVDLDLIDCH